MNFDPRRLSTTRTIDFTTFGARSGNPSRVEIWWFEVDGHLIITGTPGPRDWLANVRANPNVLVHVNGFDIEATAVEVVDEEFRRAVFEQPDTRWYSSQAELERLVSEAPMIEIRIKSGLAAV